MSAVGAIRRSGFQLQWPRKWRIRHESCCCAAQCVWKELCHKYTKSLKSPWLCWQQLWLISCWHLRWMAVAYSGFPASLILAGPPLMPLYFCCLWRDQESSARSETLGLLPRSEWPMQRVPAPFKCKQSAPLLFLFIRTPSFGSLPTISPCMLYCLHPRDIPPIPSLQQRNCNSPQSSL